MCNAINFCGRAQLCYAEVPPLYFCYSIKFPQQVIDQMESIDSRYMNGRELYLILGRKHTYVSSINFYFCPRSFGSDRVYLTHTSV